MANNLTMSLRVAPSALLMEQLWSNIRLIRPYYEFDDLQRQRPMLYYRLMDHVQADGSFDDEVINSGEVKRFFSFIAEEMELRRSNLDRLNQIIDKTIDVGLMEEDYTWHPCTYKTQIALWVTLVCKEVGIRNRWQWAEQRWGLKTLKQSYCNSQNQHQYVMDEELVLACFE